MTAQLQPQESSLSLLDEAIRIALDNQDLRAELKGAQQSAESAARSRDKARAEADQQKARADRLSTKVEDLGKEVKQARHEHNQYVQQQRAATKRALEEAKAKQEAEHLTLKSEDEQASVQLAFNQVHIHMPNAWFVLSSQPLNESEGYRVTFWDPLYTPLEQTEYGKFIDYAVRYLATKWRKDNNCLRIEDLDLPLRIVDVLDAAGYELAGDIQHKDAPEALAKIKGVGPATLKQVAAALRKEGLA